MSRFDDTIAAPATPAEPAERAVVRVAGPQAQAATRAIFMPDDPARWDAAAQPTRLPGSLTLPGFEVHGQTVPVPAAVWLWPTERSYCGQPTAEIHIPGALPIVDAVLEGLARRGVRQADRGEFTLRAVLSGRLDLLQAEAVLGVIDAADSETLSQALAQLGGGLSTPLRELRDRLLDDLADLEAGLDFVDEDIEFVQRDKLAERLDRAANLARTLHEATGSRMQPPGPPRVVLVGPANAGKSTLLNRLAGREAAVVSPVAGTTRDWVSATLDHDGRRLEWIDTAGFLDAIDDPVDAIAGRLRDELLATAAFVVWLDPYGTDARAEPAEATEARLRRLAPDAALLRCRSKLDLAAAPGDTLAVSALDGRGVEALVGTVVRAIRERRAEESTALLATTASRCRGSLEAALDALVRARELVDVGDELVAAELRRGLDALGDVLGRVDHEAVLDRLFSRFCIGK